jgi:arylsulfatase A-like enzyme
MACAVPGYVSCPYCSPTRAGLLTGRYQQRFGHEFNPVYAPDNAKIGLPLDQVTVADAMKLAGYATGAVGKWHLGAAPGFHPCKRGFDEFFGFLGGGHDYFKTDPKAGREYLIPILRNQEPVEIKDYLTEAFSREAVAFVERHRSRPFFLYLAYNAPHTPLQVPPAYLERFRAIADEKRRHYAAMVSAIDDGIGRLLSKLKDLKLDSDTLVFFLSDNGGATSKYSPNGAQNTPLRGSKGDTWEGGIRVPFLVQWKEKLPAGKVYDQPVIQLDIFPTALAAAGATAKPDWKLDGVNLLPFLEGKNAAPPHAALYWRFGEQWAIRSGNWKLVLPDLALDKAFGDIAKKPLLFNLADDISETKDLADAQPERVKQLSDAWKKWNEDLAPAAWPREGQAKLPKKDP